MIYSGNARSQKEEGNYYYQVQSFNILIVLSESPLKIWKIAVYRFSLLAAELSRFKHLKHNRKNGISDCAVLCKINQN